MWNAPRSGSDAIIMPVLKIASSVYFCACRSEASGCMYSYEREIPNFPYACLILSRLLEANQSRVCTIGVFSLPTVDTIR
jgi:hypothetical protein